jgi:hypothetical protein
MLQVELKGDQPSADGVRKRDMLFKVFGRATTSLSQVAEQVYKHEAVQKAAAQFSGAVAGTGEKWQNAQTTIGELRAATGAKVGEMQAVISTRAELLGQLTVERRDQYKGWVMEKMVTPAAGAAAAVGFFLARTEGRESSFDACRKQERVEVVDISARNCIKTTLIVQPGDTLNWTFGALLSDPSVFPALPTAPGTFLFFIVLEKSMRRAFARKSVMATPRARACTFACRQTVHAST